MTENTAPTELETFLPGENVNNETNHEISNKLNEEAANCNGGDFDPFKARMLDQPLPDRETLMHVLKASLGPDIFVMPFAFANAGLLVGIFLTIIVAIICTHCSYIVVTCAHELYKRSRKTQMSFADVAEEACKRGPKWSRKFGPWARQLVLVGLFVTYFAKCSIYMVMLAEIIKHVIYDYLRYEIDFRIYIAALLVPTLIQVYVPNLKSLVPVSVLGNEFMGLGLIIIIYYLVIDLPPISERSLAASVSTWPACARITIFAIEAIGVVMPLENNMRRPQNFVGVCGVLNKGMSVVTLIYVLLGFLGYLNYGGNALVFIPLSLPHDEYLAQPFKILIGLGVFFSFGLQFYVCLDIGWNGIKHHFVKNAKIANYTLRTIMVMICVLLAVALPMIIPFVHLIGAFCVPILGLIVPIFLEIVTFWDKGFGEYNWKIFKNIAVIFTGVIALIFQSKMAIEEIGEM